MAKSKVVDVVEEVAPEYGSEEWDAFVMSKFKEDELIDGAPLCAGLRRVSRNLLGDMIFSGPIQVVPATDTNGPGRATVVYQVTFLWKDGSTRVFSDVADVWHGNTDDLFCAHPAATASTRAEARALRKALAIRKVSADELTKKDVVSIVKDSVGVKVGTPTTGETQPTDLVTDAQKNFIDKLCAKLDINVVKLMALNGLKYDGLTKTNASALITKINVLQQDGIEKFPEGITGYEKDWK